MGVREERKKQALIWLEETIVRRDLAVLDTETTGLYGSDEIIEICVVDYIGRPLVNRRIRPGCRITRGAFLVHGITWKDVCLAPSFREVYPEIANAVANRLVLIYNASFDVGRLEYCCDKYGLPRLEFEYDCLMYWHSKWLGCKGRRRLVGGDHSAKGDCKAALALLYRMAGLPSDDW